MAASRYWGRDETWGLMEHWEQYLMKVVSAPLCGMLACMAVEDGEEALAAYGVEVDDEGVRVLHGAPGALVLGDAYPEGGMVCGMAVEDLWGDQNTLGGVGDEQRGTHAICLEVGGGDGL